MSHRDESVEIAVDGQHIQGTLLAPDPPGANTLSKDWISLGILSSLDAPGVPRPSGAAYLPDLMCARLFL